MIPGHFRWATTENIPLFLELGNLGLPVTGASPTVAIRRYRDINGAILDGYYWDGAVFTATPTWHLLIEVDKSNSPGLYTYLFEQKLVGLQYQYMIYYKNAAGPQGFAVESILVTNEVYIPEVQPDPIIVGPNSIMGQLELIKDGGDGDFDETKDSLHDIANNAARVLGLSHQNAMVDKQQYDTNRQLIYARIRVFDSPGNVPATPGGSETSGLIQEYVMESTYVDLNIVDKFTLKKVL
jgi:hypothetical protein